MVVAQSEFEAWLLAAVRSLLPPGSAPPRLPDDFDPEQYRHPKGKLERLLGINYSETVDQPKLSSCFDLYEATACCSFLKLCRDIERLVSAHRGSR